MQPRSVLQDWVTGIPLMQQTVLLTAIRGPDGVPKYAPVKWLLRWYRRCVLLSAIDQAVLPDPYSQNGGSFTGPSSIEFHVTDAPRREDTGQLDWRAGMNKLVGEYLQTVDATPHHFHMHLLHAVQILGSKHPDAFIRDWWRSVYIRFVNDLHLHPETEAELDSRLGDTREGWLKRCDPAVQD